MSILDPVGAPSKLRLGGVDSHRACRVPPVSILRPGKPITLRLVAPIHPRALPKAGKRNPVRTATPLHPTRNMALAIPVPTQPLAGDQVACAVRAGLAAQPKRLPPWLFYDEAGSRLFEEITALPEYYLTRTEHAILARHAGEMLTRASAGERLRIAELGAGSAAKTRLLLAAAVERQGSVLYEPIDISLTALLLAQARIESGVPGARVCPLVMDYTNGFRLDSLYPGERRLVLYIGSSIGNFEPAESARLLRKLRAQLAPGDSLLLGVDLVKDESTLLRAYDDAAQVTAAFNKNLLLRLNRELAADFDLEAFAHRAVWNPARSRIEMHLESLTTQRVHLAALDLEVEFDSGETIHTENSYKYRPAQAEEMLVRAGFAPIASWTDPRRWFAVCLGIAA
jgi:L-histidine Nalpha-methyltransferase